jgi:hypothetical protein
MSRLIGLMMGLVGYASVATVVSCALGYGYLRKTGKLDDDKLFQIVAIVQDVDLEAIKRESEEHAPALPGEEPSFDEQQRHGQTESLHFDAKQKQLAVSLVSFDYQLKQLITATDNYARLKREVSDYLDQQGELVLRKAMQEVRQQLEELSPKQAKPILINYIADNDMDDVISLLRSMKPKKREAIYKTFTTEEDIEMLYKIQRRMLAGEPEKPFIDEKLQALEELKAQEK